MLAPVTLPGHLKSYAKHIPSATEVQMGNFCAVGAKVDFQHAMGYHR